MAKTLELNFDSEVGTTKVTVRNPKASLTPSEIKDAMEAIVQADVFQSTTGVLVGVKSARYVERTTEEIMLP